MVSDGMIVEAEKCRSMVAQPKGTEIQFVNNDEINSVVTMPIQMNSELPQINSAPPAYNVFDVQQFLNMLKDSQDDDFFHLTCHVEPLLRNKIENGQFVELERLLPKSRAQVMDEDQRMQFVNRNGATFWVPASERETKIMNIRKSDQAFRIYSPIYCKAHPERSAEMWQYIYVIHTAASMYSWENVTYYDFTFRQLMAEKPYRSWSKIYTQAWNLALCEPITRSNQNTYGNYNGGGSSGNSNHSHSDW